MSGEKTVEITEAEFETLRACLTSDGLTSEALGRTTGSFIGQWNDALLTLGAIRKRLEGEGGVR